jgi:spore maturation protein CgeB
MKILFSGYHNPNFQTITEYVERAIDKTGHDLIIFDDRRHIIPGRIRYHVNWLHNFSLKFINKQLILIAQKTNPDMVIISGGHRIHSDTVNSLRHKGITTVLWTIDAPLNFQPIIDAAPFYDHIFCQGREAIELFEQAGIRGAKWLPMACDPEIHRPLTLSEQEIARYGNDVIFVGSHYPNREKLFESLADFDFGIWGPGWEKLPSTSPLRKLIRGGHTTPDEWMKIYNASKIVLAIHYQDPQNRFPVYQASPRVFEAMSCGVFLISDAQKDVLSLFESGKHLIHFNSPRDLIEKIEYYLTHHEQREKIAQAGQQEVLAQHTYKDRINSLLSIIKNA